MSRLPCCFVSLTPSYLSFSVSICRYSASRPASSDQPSPVSTASTYLFCCLFMVYSDLLKYLYIILSDMFVFITVFVHSPSFPPLACRLSAGWFFFVSQVLLKVSSWLKGSFFLATVHPLQIYKHRVSTKVIHEAPNTCRLHLYLLTTRCPQARCQWSFAR